ncbi:MAG: acetyl-CoA decarbonylase/synthase complex subunit delta [Euryarchaeota archaeon]|nr:acetyl-CoA decarbonylase/synthase complex subunit delta [Euryarchaeota archaeon]
MVEVPVPQEKWSGKIVTVALGNTPEEGGSRSSKLMLGGETGMPFLSFEGLGHRQRLAGEVLDDIEGITEVSIAPFIDVAEDPAAWAKKWAELGADVICLKLRSTNPEGKDASPEDAVRTVQDVLEAVDLPIIVYGCGSEEKDAKTMEAVSNACAKERVLLGQAEEGAYKSISAAATVNGHGIVAYSNLDVNLAKQMNILLADFGVKLENVLMDPLMAALGMGLEYSYSVNERIRLAALMGDRMLQAPMLCDLTSAWETREATEENDAWGDVTERGAWWEATTGLAALLSGADLLIVRHPRCLEILQDAITELRGE